MGFAHEIPSLEVTRGTPAPSHETTRQKFARLAQLPTRDEAPQGYRGPFKPDNYYRYLNRGGFDPNSLNQPVETAEQRRDRLNLLPTRDEAPQGYRGPYKPNNYDAYLGPVKKESQSQVIVFRAKR